MASIAEKKVVSIHYTLKGADGKLLESTRGHAPVAYLHGHGNVVPGLEAALLGKNPGDKVDVTIPAELAYGERKGKGAQAVPRKEFPRGMDLREGMPLEIKDSSGTPVRVWITRVQGSKVWLDVDHPLAGQALTFDVEVMDVRDAEPEELEHGHVHDGHGHHH